jgi:penicillin-binding protein 1C
MPGSLLLWPAALEPWLPRSERRSARLPASDPACPPQGAALAAPLSIVGVRQGDRLRRPAGSAEPLRLRLSALGGAGRRWWFVNGQPLGETAVVTSSACWTRAARPHAWRSVWVSRHCLARPLRC